MNAKRAILCLCLWCVPFSTPALAEGRYALLVASRQFAPASRYPTLEAPKNDLQMMTSLLTLKFGFHPQDITIVGVTDGACGPGYRYASPQATHGALEEAFGRLARIARRSDYIVFYYSGHGARIRDTNGDEEDGWDEALVTYPGTPASFVIDDELHTWLQRIHAKQVTVIADTCFSGTISRSTEQFGRPKFVSVVPASPPLPQREAPKRRRARAARASDVLLAASGEGELADEEPVLGPRGEWTGVYVSSFTWELYRELVWSKQPQVSCSELAQTLAKRLAGRRRGQRPAVDPPGSEAVFIAPPPRSAFRSYVPVLRRTPMAVQLGLGYLAGMRQGMELGPDSTAPSQGLVLAVTDADWFESSARVVKGAGEIPPSLIARQPPVPTPGGRLRTATRQKGADGLQDEMERLLSDVATFDEEGPADALLEFDAQAGKVQLVEPDEHRIDIPADLETARELISRYRAGLQIGRLDSSAHPLGLRIASPDGDFPTYHIGDNLRLSVEAERAGYLLVLDVAADGQINVLFPNEGVADAAIVSGRRYVLGGPEMRFTLYACPPAGQDRVVAILSTRPLPRLETLLAQTSEAAAPGARSVGLGKDSDLLKTVASILQPSAAEPRSRGASEPDAIVDVASLTVRITDAEPSEADSAAPEAPGLLD